MKNGNIEITEQAANRYLEREQKLDIKKIRKELHGDCISMLI